MKLPFMKFFTVDWRDGTRRLTWAQKGFYAEILTYLHDGENVPADPGKLATFLKCNPRTVRTLLPPLLETGNLVKRDDQLVSSHRNDANLESVADQYKSAVEDAYAGLMDGKEHTRLSS